MSLRQQRGFTLIELMIVVIVVGVLAAVAIPMYQIVPERSRSTEAVSALGLIRKAMRIHYAEHGGYANANFTNNTQVTVGGVLDVNDSDLLGRYFSTECYTFDGAPGAGAFTIECDGSSSTAPHASEVATIVITIDEGGEITSTW